MIYKCEAQDDVLYFETETQEEASQKLKSIIGDDVPESLLTWTIVDAVPAGYDLL